MVETKVDTTTHFGVPWKRWAVGIVVISIIITSGVVGFLVFDRDSPNATSRALKIIKQQVSFPIYFPTELSNYFFIDNGSIKSSNGYVFFSIVRNDGKKIVVTEQAMPSNFTLDDVNGLQHEIPSVGTVVIGNGFQGQRAVLKTNETLIIITTTKDISAADLQSITYSFQKF